MVILGGYLLSKVDFDVDWIHDKIDEETKKKKQTPTPYKIKLIEVGKAIRDSYISKKDVNGFERDVLQGLAHNKLTKYWLWEQLKILEEESKVNAQQIWFALALDDNLSEVLFLLRLLWTDIYKETTRTEVNE